MPIPPKVALNQRLHREGRHAEFIAVRDQLKLEGTPEQVAWIYAAAKFPPLDGSPLEVRVPGPIDVGAENGNVAGDGQPTAAELRSDVAAFMAAAVDTKSEEDRIFEELYSRVDNKRKASTVLMIDWVFEYAPIRLSEINPEEVPSRGALRLLKLVQSSEKRYGDFILSLWSKIIPTKSSLDLGGRFSDDGRKRLVLMEEFEAEFAATNS